MKAASLSRAVAAGFAALLAVSASAEAASRSRAGDVFPPPRPASLGGEVDVAAHPRQWFSPRLAKS
jgi:hypothetical protein